MLQQQCESRGGSEQSRAGASNGAGAEPDGAFAYSGCAFFQTSASTLSGIFLRTPSL